MSASLPYDRLKPAQRLALLAIVRGENFEDAADHARVSTRTLQRWRRQPDFQQALVDARDNFLESCQAEVAAGRLQAFQALTHLSRWGGVDRVRAATALLNYLERPEMSRKSSRKQPSLNAVNDLDPQPGDKTRQSATSSDKPDPTPVIPALSGEAGGENQDSPDQEH